MAMLDTIFCLLEPLICFVGIITLVVLNLLGLGLLNGTKADLRLAVEDVAAILRGAGGERE